ncbi:hypothetical protein EYC84_004691 [Monilinia fructicola]|uniref:Uncharacterized protein n=1 Tax=Monilinia fructicola TaxID=38448 RepID=A0A5M9K3N5_MONFR|nr:hypothetical protein EYC84_004691 [Monilinia fructicola]
MIVNVYQSLGNAASLPPRLPFLSTVPRKLEKLPSVHDGPVQYVFVCCSYRGYWKSRGRPSEKGIMRDAEATMQWVKRDFESRPNPNGCEIVLWGQKIDSRNPIPRHKGHARDPLSAEVASISTSSPIP